MSYENLANRMYRYKISYIGRDGNIKVEKRDFKHGITSFPKQWLFSKLLSLGMDTATCQQVSYLLSCQCLPGSGLTPTYKVLYSNNIIKVEARQV